MRLEFLWPIIETLTSKSILGPGVGELTFATVRGAGHQVPTFQSQRADDLFSWFVGDV